MSEVKKIATRDSYGAALVELAKDHPDVVVLDADLAAATKTGVFKKAYPDRHFDCGIAESNMMATAAGMAAMGLVPFASSFAMFAAGRAFEQVRNSIGYPHLNVKIGATHGGISVGEDGASHQCCEDFALMRSIPGMTVLCPADDVEAKAAVKAAYEHEGPVYLRFGRLAVPVFHDEANYHFELGKGEQLTEGNDIAIIATGLMVNEARMAAEQLAAEGIHARVINIHTIKPLDEEIVLKAAKECGKVITAEEHNVIGGLGEAVCSLLSEKLPTPVRRVGVQDKFGCSGPAWDLLKEYGLDGIDIDWEYPGTSLAGIASDRSDKENYTLLLAELRKTLDAYREGMLVTTAVGGDVYFALQTDMKEASRYLDYVQLMTYDLQGGFQKVTGHHAALYHSEGNLFDACVEKAVNGFANAGVPMEKLILGVPFYSRKWDGVKGAGCRNGLGMEAETVGGYGGDYGELKESWIGKRGFIRYWDEQAKVPYLFDGETFISYEDCESLGVKIAYLKEKGMGGIMFWEYKCDPSGELLSFIKKNM